MLELKIRELQNELNYLIKQEVDYSYIYELSVKLDEVILQYYMEKMNSKQIS